MRLLTPLCLVLLGGVVGCIGPFANRVSHESPEVVMQQFSEAFITANADEFQALFSKRKGTGGGDDLAELRRGMRETPVSSVRILQRSKGLKSHFLYPVEVILKSGEIARLNVLIEKQGSGWWIERVDPGRW